MKNRTPPRPRLGAHFHVGLAVICLSAAPPAVGSAQVIEIDDVGGVTVHNQPEVTLAAGSTVIETSNSRRASYLSPQPINRSDLVEGAQHAEISPELLEAVAWRESGVKPGRVSPVGAVGEMQLMPKTARDLGVDPYNSRQNFSGGAAYLSALLKRYDGDLVRALAAYNAGPAAVDKYGGVPPYKETQAYVAAILDRLSRRAVADPKR